MTAYAAGLWALVSVAAAAPAAVSVTAPEGAMAVVGVTVGGTASPGTVCAFDVVIDGRENSQGLVFTDAARTVHETLVGPLTQGTHTIAVRPSPLWPWPSPLVVQHASVDLIAPGSDRYELLRWAPRLGLRSDTIGGRSDLPLLLFAERVASADGRRLRYSVVFSNEDGGTPARALMARWGRTTDIEWASEVHLVGGSARAWSYQGPDHDTRQVVPPPAQPALLVATQNNVFLAAGISRANVQLVPRLVDLDAATRESVMDGEPWIYGFMSRELAEEGKLDDGDGEDVKKVADPRRYLYAEARLRLRQAAVAAWIEPARGPWRSSHRGHPALKVSRDGWVRVAIEMGEAVPVRFAWECSVSTETPASPPPGSGCDVDVARLFMLDAGYRPGDNLVEPATLRLRVGEIGVVPLRGRPLTP
jgi:hypothetical protein